MVRRILFAAGVVLVLLAALGVASAAAHTEGSEETGQYHCGYWSYDDMKAHHNSIHGDDFDEHHNWTHGNWGVSSLPALLSSLIGLQV